MICCDIHLNKQEWIDLIKNSLLKIYEKKTGELLIKKLYNFLINGRNIKISNMDIDSNIIYPKVKFINKYYNEIIIPNVPYFQNIQTIDKKLCEDVDDVFLEIC